MPDSHKQARSWSAAFIVRIALLVTAALLSGAAYFLQFGPIWSFGIGVLAIAVFAEWIRRSTEQLALHTGPIIGGLLTVSFGSLAEFVLAIFVLLRGQTAVVHGQITGSIIGTCLFGLGLALIVGGIRRPRQHFKRERASLLSSMLIVVVIALLLPAVFDHLGGPARDAPSVKVSNESLSLVTSVVLLILYCGNLLYTLVTHHDVFSSGEPSQETPQWSTTVSLMILAAAAAGAAFESEMVSGALVEAANALHLTPLFIGVVILALIGTSSDIFAAVWFAHKNQINLVMSICIGSAIQIALVVAPLLVIISYMIGRPMTLVFEDPLDLFSIAGTAFIVNSIAGDGETTWFEGMLLVGVYFVLGSAYFLD
jgi:Ca2+:H+ antiporter